MWQLILILVCIVLNGILAATELAFVSVSRAHLKKLVQEKDKAALRVMHLREHPERTLSVLQLGITFIGVVAAAVGGFAMEKWVGPTIQSMGPLSKGASSFLSILLFVVPYTYLNVVLSELLPKSLAFRNPAKVILKMSRSVMIIGNLLAPIVYLLEKSTKFFAKLIGRWYKSDEGVREEAIVVGKMVRPYMLNLAQVEGKKIEEAMIPWEEIDFLVKTDETSKVKQLILEKGHTRLPILEQEEVVGLLFTKEYISATEEEQKNWTTLIRPIILLDKGRSMIEGLRLMQNKHSHLSVVVEGKKPVGIVTIEDILEEIVGEIYDEDDITNG